MRASARVLCALCLCLVGPGAHAKGFSYRVEGVSAAARENIRAFLGASPRNQEEADRFLITAPLRAEQALEALGYYRHNVELELDERRRKLIVRVDAGKPLTYTSVAVQLVGAGADDEELNELLERRAPRPGDPVHHGVYEELKAQLQQLASSRGYFDAVFKRREIEIDVGEGRADLDLEFDTGPRYRLGPVAHDSSIIDDELLASLLPFAEGDPFLYRSLLDLRQRLLRLGFFSSVVVVPDLEGRAEGLVPIRVDLAAAPAHSYEVGVGYSTDTRQRASLIWRSPRLNRRGHSQQTSLRWSPVNPALRTVYSIPLDAPANDVLQLIARFESNEYGDLDSDQVELGTRREWTGPSGVRAISLRGLREEWSAFEEDFSARFVLAGASLSRRSRGGDVVDPSSGLSQFYSVEAGSKALGSDQDLVRVYGRFTGVRRLSENWRVVSRGELGLVWSTSKRPDELPPSLSFFAGGDNSIRGFAYQSIGREVLPQLLEVDAATQPLVVGGNRLVTGSIEMQRYFGKNWRGALFVDAGDAFVDDDLDLNVGVGIGLHYLTPVGALRLEIAGPVSDSDKSWRFHINIGAEF